MHVGMCVCVHIPDRIYFVLWIGRAAGHPLKGAKTKE